MQLKGSKTEEHLRLPSLANHRLTAATFISQQKLTWKASTTWLPCSAPLLKVKPAMHTDIWNIWKSAVTRNGYGFRSHRRQPENRNRG